MTVADRCAPIRLGVGSHWDQIGAGDGTRTRDPLLGKQMLYQLSYSRSDSRFYGPRAGGRRPRRRRLLGLRSAAAGAME